MTQSFKDIILEEAVSWIESGQQVALATVVQTWGSSPFQIGRWSAEMILLFTYNRPNIWPIQDIGLLRAISKNYNKKYLPPESYLKYLNKKFSPYCSVATWYLWRSIDPEPIQY